MCSRSTWQRWVPQENQTRDGRRVDGCTSADQRIWSVVQRKRTTCTGGCFAPRLSGRWDVGHTGASLAITEVFAKANEDHAHDSLVEVTVATADTDATRRSGVLDSNRRWTTSQFCNGHSNEELPWSRRAVCGIFVPPCSHHQFRQHMCLTAQTNQRTCVCSSVHKQCHRMFTTCSSFDREILQREILQRYVFSSSTS